MKVAKKIIKEKNIKKQNTNFQILEGSRAIAETIKIINPDVISAYPITPQTHIVEDLAKYKADGEADYEFVRAESEFAAASIVLGASATGVRVYTATSSQGILLMAEVIYNIAGLRLPVVMTCANRAIGAPINIWNDQQDAMTVRDAGWIMLFAENHQEAVMQHILAYKIAETVKIPVMVNVDGFVLTHSYEPVAIPSAKDIKKFLPSYKPTPGQYLDVKNPVSLGGVAFPSHYMEIREELHNDLANSLTLIEAEYKRYISVISQKNNAKVKIIDSGLLEYYGSANPEVVLVAMGSVVGTIKDVVDEHNQIPPNPLYQGGKTKSNKNPLDKGGRGIGVLKVKCYRPFPADEILKIIKNIKYIAVLDKSIALGIMGALAGDIKMAAQGKIKGKIQSFIVGLGGRDVTKEMIKKIIKEVKKGDDKVMFVGKA